MNVIEVITNKVLDAVKTGLTLPWTKPWKTSAPANVISGKPYRGINWFITTFFGNDNLFLTFNQARAKGGFVKKGAKGLPIVFYKRVGKGTFDAKGQEETYGLLRYFTVFALKDCEGLDHLRPTQGEFKPIATAEAIVARIDAPITHGGNIAAYTPERHAIVMPLRESFSSEASYYASLFHEAIHAASKALGRKLEGYGVAYSKEELVAEMGASMLANAAGIWCEDLEKNSVAYVAGWLKKLAVEPKLLLDAAKEAQKRVDYLLGVSPNVAEEGEGATN